MTLAIRYESDAADLCLDFSVEDETFGARTVHNLVSGENQLAVTIKPMSHLC